MNLKDKLARLDSGRAGNDRYSFSGASLREEGEWIAQVERELDIKVMQEEHSYLLLKENYYPIYHHPLFCDFRESGFQANRLHHITGDLPQEQVNLKQAVFIDTETTGLAGGTGTYAFLVGIGHLELDHIVVRQYLLPDFCHEWLMLKFLDQAAQPFGWAVSFNGKTFDFPLLKSRYVLNRMTTVLEDLPHFDLLHAARRLWKMRLPACDLQTLEQVILLVNRCEDVPGYLIPQIYFEFIRMRRALPLRDVLEHNFHDIVNMILLTLKIAAICEAPLRHLEDQQDLFSLARYYFEQKRYEEAIPLLEHTVEHEDSAAARWLTRAFLLLSLAYKKSGNAEAAKAKLRYLLERQVLDPTVIEELAKFYEHDDRDYAAACEVVEKGLQYLDTLCQLNSRSELMKFLPRLRHRQQRLLRKLQRKL